MSDTNSNSDLYKVLPNGKKFYLKASAMDIVVSIILPIFGLIAGLISLAKGEKRRAKTLLGIFVIMILISFMIRSL